MEDFLIIEKAIEEIEQRRLGTTKQLLEVHEVVYEEDKPKVLRVDKESQDGSVVVYFPVKGQKFYVSIHLHTEPAVTVQAVGAEPYHLVCFSVTSETLTFEQLSSLTTLTPLTGWSKGDLRKFANSFYTASTLHFEPNPEPDEFEDKLKKLLDALEQDKQGVQALASQGDILVQVASIFHNGNTMLGGHYLTKEIIKRLAALELSIDFDLYAKGKFFK